MKFVLFGSTTFFLASPYTLTVVRFGWNWAQIYRGDWLITCKLSRSYALLDSRFWEWKQSCSSSSWSLCFLVWPLFSSLALIPWQLIDLDEISRTHSKVDSLSTCKLSFSYAPLDSRFCDWKHSRSSISWSLCFLVGPLFSSLSRIPWQIIDLDELLQTHSRGDWLTTCKISTSYALLDSRFRDCKQSRSSILWNSCFLVGPLFSLAIPSTLTVVRFRWNWARI